MPFELSHVSRIACGRETLTGRRVKHQAASAVTFDRPQGPVWPDGSVKNLHFILGSSYLGHRTICCGTGGLSRVRPRDEGAGKRAQTSSKPVQMPIELSDRKVLNVTDDYQEHG